MTPAAYCVFSSVDAVRRVLGTTIPVAVDGGSTINVTPMPSQMFITRSRTNFSLYPPMLSEGMPNGGLRVMGFAGEPAGEEELERLKLPSRRSAKSPAEGRFLNWFAVGFNGVRRWAEIAEQRWREEAKWEESVEEEEKRKKADHMWDHGPKWRQGLPGSLAGEQWQKEDARRGVRGWKERGAHAGSKKGTGTRFMSTEADRGVSGDGSAEGTAKWIPRKPRSALAPPDPAFQSDEKSQETQASAETEQRYKREDYERDSNRAFHPPEKDVRTTSYAGLKITRYGLDKGSEKWFPRRPRGPQKFKLDFKPTYGPGEELWETQTPKDDFLFGEDLIQFEHPSDPRQSRLWSMGIGNWKKTLRDDEWKQLRAERKMENKRLKRQVLLHSAIAKPTIYKMEDFDVARKEEGAEDEQGGEAATKKEGAAEGEKEASTSEGVSDEASPDATTEQPTVDAPSPEEAHKALLNSLPREQLTVAPTPAVLYSRSLVSSIEFAITKYLSRQATSEHITLDYVEHHRRKALYALMLTAMEDNAIKKGYWEARGDIPSPACVDTAGLARRNRGGEAHKMAVPAGDVLSLVPLEELGLSNGRVLRLSGLRSEREKVLLFCGTGRLLKRKVL